MDHVSWVPTGGAVGITAGDLDGDGKPELIFNNTMSGHLKGIRNYIYLDNQGAQYAAERRLELPTDGSNQSLVADLDLDGYPEVVFTDAAALRIFRGRLAGPSPDQLLRLPANPG